MSSALPQPHVLVFGASGVIGGSIVDWFAAQAWSVTACSRRPAAKADRKPGVNWVATGTPSAAPDPLAGLAPVDAVVWAQGQNFNDSVHAFDAEAHLDMYRANVLHVLDTAARLVAADRLRPPARLCVISSIWQELARPDKLSYCVTKAALRGLVLSLSTDLARHGHLVNAVLPGALDTPMTRQNLSPGQIGAIEAGTLFGRLPAVRDVCELVGWLCSDRNSGVTGQFIGADLGFSRARIF